MPHRVGQQLGNYRLMRLLGEGGFAEVYLGEHIHLGTQAAIKVLHTQITGDSSEQFRSEALLVAHLEHSNIVRILDFDIEERTPFLVMSYAPNGTLRKRHPRGVPLPLSTIVPYVEQVASALQYAHDLKLIHRDVKPENMLIGRQNEILLSDFGIALIAQSSRYQHTRDIVGTVAYMAPEQIQGKPRPASDQYALGIVVYEWLSGELPFKGSFTEVAVQHVAAEPPSLHEKQEAISPEIEEIMRIVLAKDPQQRFGSIQAFANAFTQASHVVQGHEPPSLKQIKQQEPPYTVKTEEEMLLTILATPISNQKGETRSTENKFSRRAALLVIAGVAVASAAGGLGWFLAQQKGSSVSSSQPAGTPSTTIPLLTSTSAATSTPKPSDTPSPVSTTVTPISLGTIFDTYRGHTGYIYGVTWASLDGQRIASASFDTTVQVWSPTTNGVYFVYRHNAAVNDVKASHDKTRIASAGEDSIVQVKNATTGESILTYQNHSDAVNTVEWAPDNIRIITASRDKTVQVWDGTNGNTQTTYRGHSNEVWAAGWSPDGLYVLSASADGTAQVWNASTGETVFVYRGHSATVRSVSWSPDGQRVATASEDKTVHVWEPFTGRTLLIYRGHSNLMRTVAWSPDSQRIVSGARDATAQIWNASTGETLLVYHGHTATVFDAQWSPDGTRIASCSTDTTVQIWQAS